jgi:hypothetical protein
VKKDAFKPVARRPSAEEMVSISADTMPDAPSVRAEQSAPLVPPVPAAKASEPVVGLNLKVLLSTSDAVAAAAKEQGVSMKTVVMRALSSAGVAVASLDLEDRTPARRKGR